MTGVSARGLRGRLSVWWVRRATRGAELKKKTIDANPDEGTNVDLSPLANR